MNDFEVYDLVTRFIGYGGAFYHEKIAKKCRFYIKSASLLPLLALALTAEEYKQLNYEFDRYYREGLHLIEEDEVIIKSERGVESGS